MVYGWTLPTPAIQFESAWGEEPIYFLKRPVKVNLTVEMGGKEIE